MRLLVTRPSTQAEATVQALRKLGHDCRVEPLLTVEFLNTDDPIRPVDGLLVTSVNVLAFLQQHFVAAQRGSVPVLATGKTTAEQLRAAGFALAEHVNGSALDLVEEVPHWLKRHGLSGDSQLLYPSAQTVAHDVPHLLNKLHINCRRVAVYRTVAANRLSADTLKALKRGEIDAVLLYSGRTAQTFVELMRQNKVPMNGLKALVLSRAIYEGLPMELKLNAEFPSAPNEAALLQLIGS